MANEDISKLSIGWIGAGRMGYAMAYLLLQAGCDVTVEGEFVGRLEGFRFRADKAGGPDEAKTLRQAADKALAPQFHLRADRFYNAPDTEIDVTEQGGLMWGSSAVGKLVSGADPFKPQVVAYVDEEAGTEITDKVKRRLQHFIDRKIAATQEPLLALGNDETLSGQAKGFAYRMVENFGIIPRGEVAEEVRALDQEARGALRKHGIRFGQFTIFMPLLLKPAPTRLRLVLRRYERSWAQLSGEQREAAYGVRGGASGHGRTFRAGRRVTVGAVAPVTRGKVGQVTRSD